MVWTQLEELKQQQKLDRQKEQEKKRKLETNPSVAPPNVELVKVQLGFSVNEITLYRSKKHITRAGVEMSLISHEKQIINC